VSDCEPMNQFEFLRPLYERYGGRYPPFRVPAWLVMGGAFIAEAIHRALKPVHCVAPFLTCMEVSKITCTHYFSTDKIRRVLGYRPLVHSDEGMRRTVDHLLQDPQHLRHRSVFMPVLLVLLALLVFCMLRAVSPLSLL
jgi:hypothetical protein